MRIIKIALILVICWIGYAVFKGDSFNSFDDIIPGISERLSLDDGGGPASSSAARPNTSYYGSEDRYAGGKPPSDSSSCRDELANLKAKKDKAYQKALRTRSAYDLREYKEALDAFQRKISRC